MQHPPNLKEVFDKLTTNREYIYNTHLNQQTMRTEIDQWVVDLANHYYELGKKHAFNESMQTPALFKGKTMVKMIDTKLPYLVTDKVMRHYEDSFARNRTDDFVASINNLDNELQRRAGEIRQLRSENERLKQEVEKHKKFTSRWFWLTDGKLRDRICNHVIDHVEARNFRTLEEYVDFKLNERN